jgi:acyl carrier protein
MPKPALDSVEIERWLVAQLAQRLELLPGDIDPTVAFADLGVDSIAAVNVAAQMQADLDLTLADTALWDYPTIRDLATHLATLAIAHRPD